MDVLALDKVASQQIGLGSRGAIASGEEGAADPEPAGAGFASLGRGP